MAVRICKLKLDVFVMKGNSCFKLGEGQELNFAKPGMRKTEIRALISSFDEDDTILPPFEATLKRKWCDVEEMRENVKTLCRAAMIKPPVKYG